MPITPYFSKFKHFYVYAKVFRDDGTWWDGWKCKLCGKVIHANTSGAQSHLAKHVREKLNADRVIDSRT
jgi:hypothetical protein